MLKRYRLLPLLLLTLPNLVVRTCSSRHYFPESEEVEKSKPSDLEDSILATFHMLKGAMHTARGIINSLIQPRTFKLQYSWPGNRCLLTQ